ncbi:hypothetical protein GMYAFLOJ_CDS0025 [Microbacterium phage phiMiGM15]
MPSPITVINESTPPAEDAALVSFLTRVEVKLDQALTRGVDHEDRIRVLEARKTVAPRDLWLGVTGAVGAGAGIATIIAHLLPA